MPASETDEPTPTARGSTSNAPPAVALSPQSDVLRAPEASTAADEANRPEASMKALVDAATADLPPKAWIALGKASTASV